ncbi:MAG: tRNA 2-selenouridine(34) synthase MnmH [Zoogloeaceae bacterium]|nr:tRNA 2-selenouridine(34) synthase MnmH [Rhodocyclaceae bacterium]MCP5235558.1 tRNA 2-selenouridine(34) synthase MnmH [Zoogloeaceae bacterium]
MSKGVATVAQVDRFDEIIDVRSPSEFAEDAIPGAINCPVLDDDERARVGTLYKQVSPFDARRVGGALVARNIAKHLEARFLDRPRSWRPLIYCWRGGQRSGSMVTWMRMIGWDACQLDGGYKAWRRHAVQQIDTLAQRISWRVVCGATGSGKTRLLEALATEGAQILDLEGLACHKGSVLGALPGRPQPSQKRFESGIWSQLVALDPDRPVFVEAESKKIGRVHVPDALIEAMRGSDCIAIDATRAARLEFLLRDYAYLGDDPDDLAFRLSCLKSLQSNETLARWHELAMRRDLSILFAELIDLHYDPLYHRSQNRNYRRFTDAHRYPCDDLRPAGLSLLAGRILAETGVAASAPST